MKYNDVVKDLEVEMVEQEFLREKKSAFREFEDQKVYLKDQLIALRGLSNGSVRPI